MLPFTSNEKVRADVSNTSSSPLKLAVPGSIFTTLELDDGPGNMEDDRSPITMFAWPLPTLAPLVLRKVPGLGRI
jgi:hypothetical protein